MYTIPEFSSAERKALIRELFPLKTDERFSYLYQDMTLAGYTGEVLTLAQKRLDSGLIPSDAKEFLRLADIVRNDSSAELEEIYTAWKAECQKEAAK